MAEAGAVVAIKINADRWGNGEERRHSRRDSCDLGHTRKSRANRFQVLLQLLEQEHEREIHSLRMALFPGADAVADSKHTETPEVTFESVVAEALRIRESELESMRNNHSRTSTVGHGAHKANGVWQRSTPHSKGRSRSHESGHARHGGLETSKSRHTHSKPLPAPPQQIESVAQAGFLESAQVSHSGDALGAARFPTAFTQGAHAATAITESSGPQPSSSPSVPCEKPVPSVREFCVPSAKPVPEEDERPVGMDLGASPRPLSAASALAGAKHVKHVNFEAAVAQASFHKSDSSMSKHSLTTVSTLESSYSSNPCRGSQASRCSADLTALASTTSGSFSVPLRAGNVLFSLHSAWDQDSGKSVIVKQKDVNPTETLEDLHDILGGLDGIDGPAGGHDILGGLDPQTDDLRRPGEWKKAQWIMSPNSWHAQLFDILLMSIVLYDAVSMPLLVFDLPATNYTRGVDWFTRILWTLVIPRTFCTGYLMQNGMAEMRPRLIASNYLKSWFMLDFLIAGFDWVEWLVLSGIGVDFGAQGGAIRLLTRFRMARIVPRLMRIGRLPKLAQRIGDYFYSQKNILFMGILKVSIIFIFFVHYIACTWYALGRYASGPTWLDDYESWNKTFAWRYAISLHWAITQFIGNIEVNPVNLVERYFCAICLILTFIASASFVSRLAASMTRLHMLTGQQDIKIAHLRQYLFHNKVSAELSSRVVRIAECAENDQNQTISEADVDLLLYITEPLMMEIHFEVYSKTLTLHPFFFNLARIDLSGMRRLCHRAISPLNAPSGDVIFNLGERASNPQMLFITQGTTLYMKPDARRKVEKGTQLCEQVLWTTWVHLGTLCTVSSCSLILLDAEETQCLVSTWQSASYAVEYAQVYLKHLNMRISADPSSIDDVSDGGFNAAEAAQEISGQLERRRKFRVQGMHGLRGLRHSFGSLIAASRAPTPGGGRLGGVAPATARLNRTRSQL